jgi:hypothetical protein
MTEVSPGTEFASGTVEVSTLMAVEPMYSRLVDPSYLPKNLTVGDMLFRINAMSPEDYEALEKIIAHVFKRDWEHLQGKRSWPALLIEDTPTT